MSDTVQNGKGSKRRPGSLKAYEDGWERIWGKKIAKRKSDPKQPQSKDVCQHCGGTKKIDKDYQIFECPWCSNPKSS